MTARANGERYAHYVGEMWTGFILLTAHRSDDTLTNLLDDEIPVVTVNRVPTNREVSSVRADDTAGITAVVEHLVELGHSRLAMIAGSRNLSTGLSRLRAFKAALRTHRLELRNDDVVIARSFSEAEGYRCAAELLSSRRRHRRRRGERYTGRRLS